MRGSFFLLVHFLGFGLFMTSLIGGWVIELRLRSEEDIRFRLSLCNLIRKMGILSPLATILLLITGIGNIYYLLGTAYASWFSQGWLAMKIIFFVLLVMNGAVYGPQVSRGRTKLFQQMLEASPPEGATEKLRFYNRQMLLFYLVQILLLILILYLSIFGGGKHPANI